MAPFRSPRPTPLPALLSSPWSTLLPILLPILLLILVPSLLPFLPPGFGAARAAQNAGDLLRAQMQEQSRVRYHASDPRDAWTGTAPIEALELRFDVADLRRLRLRVEVPAGAFDSGNFIRDANARRALFEAARFPWIVFEAERAQAADGVPADLPDGASRELTLEGMLTLHGVTRPLSPSVRVTRRGDLLTAETSFDVRLSDFDMRRPSLLGVVVDDLVRVEVEIDAILTTP